MALPAGQGRLVIPSRSTGPSTTRCTWQSPLSARSDAGSGFRPIGNVRYERARNGAGEAGGLVRRIASRLSLSRPRREGDRPDPRALGRIECRHRGEGFGDRFTERFPRTVLWLKTGFSEVSGPTRGKPGAILGNPGTWPFGRHPDTTPRFRAIPSRCPQDEPRAHRPVAAPSARFRSGT